MNGMAKASGVYAIVHRGSGKLYIGSAVNISRRWNAHLWGLRRNAHHANRLQRAWNKHGEDSFVFAVVRFCPVADLIREEQRWIDETDASGSHGYNSCPTAGSVLGIKQSPEAVAKRAAANRGQKRTPEFRARMSELSRKQFTPEFCAKMSEAQRGRKQSPEAIAKVAAFHRGRKQSPETIAKRAAAIRGRKHTPEAIARMSEACRGRKHTPETCAKLSAARKGRKPSPEAIAKTAAANRGRKRSPETIAKIVATRRAKKLARMSMVQGELFP